MAAVAAQVAAECKVLARTAAAHRRIRRPLRQQDFAVAALHARARLQPRDR
jgi:hypothetical protein